MSPLDYPALARSQDQDAELKDSLQHGSALRLERVHIPGTDVSLYCDTSTSQPRPFITTPFRRQVFDTLHGFSHSGANATVKLVSQRFVWPGVGKDCRAWTRACTPCQRSKVTRHVKAPLGSFHLPSAHFSHVRVDLVGPLPVSSGFRYCLTAIDRYTRRPEAVPLSDITAEAVAKAFVSVWVARFGYPQHITTDQGRQFEVRLFKTLATITGSSLTRTTAWHPASNGMIERLHCQLKAALMCHADKHWAEALPLVLLGIRSAWKDDLKAPSAELVYGSPLRLPGDFFAPSPAACTVTDFASRLRVHIGKLRPVPASRHAAPSAFIFKDLATASYVFLRHGPLREPSKPRMSAHTGSSTGAIRPIP